MEGMTPGDLTTVDGSHVYLCISARETGSAWTPLKMTTATVVMSLRAVGRLRVDHNDVPASSEKHLWRSPREKV